MRHLDNFLIILQTRLKFSTHRLPGIPLRIPPIGCLGRSFTQQRHVAHHPIAAVRIRAYVSS